MKTERTLSNVLVFLWGMSGIPATVQAEVTLDGSMTDGVPLEINPAFDPAIGRNDFRIEQEMGRLQGANLFHSFGRFSLSRTESATFRGNAAIDNVIGRVTGGFESSINGLLRSTIPGANVYLINPAIFKDILDFRVRVFDSLAVRTGRSSGSVPAVRLALT